MRRPIIIIGGLITMAAISHLTFRFALGQERSPVGDAQAGARIAEEGTSAGAPACVSCHGVDGNPDGSGTFPRLFGLPQNYLFKQLGDYAGGRQALKSIVGGTIWAELYLALCEIGLGEAAGRGRLHRWRERVEANWHEGAKPDAAAIARWIESHHPVSDKAGGTLFQDAEAALQRDG